MQANKTLKEELYTRLAEACAGSLTQCLPTLCICWARICLLTILSFPVTYWLSVYPPCAHVGPECAYWPYCPSLWLTDSVFTHPVHMLGPSVLTDHTVLLCALLTQCLPTLCTCRARVCLLTILSFFVPYWLSVYPPCAHVGPECAYWPYCPSLCLTDSVFTHLVHMLGPSVLTDHAVLPCALLTQCLPTLCTCWARVCLLTMLPLTDSVLTHPMHTLGPSVLTDHAASYWLSVDPPYAYIGPECAYWLCCPSPCLTDSVFTYSVHTLDPSVLTDHTVLPCALLTVIFKTESIIWTSDNLCYPSESRLQTLEFYLKWHTHWQNEENLSELSYLLHIRQKKTSRFPWMHVFITINMSAKIAGHPGQ